MEDKKNKAWQVFEKEYKISENHPSEQIIYMAFEAGYKAALEE